jgi:hypothetical protein
MATGKSGSTRDREQELSASERHVLQQLWLWKDIAGSVEEFRHKKEQALADGFDNSGPIQESQVLGSIVRDLEEKLAQRLLAEKMGH